jgi:hypothetical protein
LKDGDFFSQAGGSWSLIFIRFAGYLGHFLRGRGHK